MCNVMNLRNANQQVYEKKNLSLIFSFMYFAFIFSECITIISYGDANTVYFKKYKESSVTCNLPVQLRFIQANFLYVEYGIWRSLEYSFCQKSWNSSFLAK